MVLKVQVEETAGRVGKRVAALEAKLREQGDDMAAMQSDMADMRRAMALLKGMAATGASAEKSEGEAGKRSAPGEQSQGGAQPNGAQEREEVKSLAGAAMWKAQDVVAEMGPVKAELARMRGAAERQAAEVAYVKATVAHSEARINDAELALAAIKDGRAEKSRAERNEGSGEEHAGEERREGKRRKRDEAGEKGGMAGAAAGAGRALIANGGEAVIKRNEAEKGGEAPGRKNGVACDTKAELQTLRARVKALEKMSTVGSRSWEALTMIWSEAIPDMTEVNLSGIPFLTDTALTQVANFSSLTSLNLNDTLGFTGAGLKGLFSLTGLTCLSLQSTATTDAALEGISSLQNLSSLDLSYTKITDVGIAKLQGMTALVHLLLGACAAVTNASMVHVGKLTGLEFLTLSDTGVTEDGLLRLSTLASLKLLVLPPGVTDSGMKHLRNLKRLEKLGLWDAKITAAGVKWLKGLKWLQAIATDAEDVAEPRAAMGEQQVVGDFLKVTPKRYAPAAPVETVESGGAADRQRDDHRLLPLRALPLRRHPLHPRAPPSPLSPYHFAATLNPRATCFLLSLDLCVHVVNTRNK
ncbi:unnamed protein product [Closterium sp. Yama58-4]|nr:unnamed protein product [Closterium sp. Yama58-4]